MKNYPLLILHNIFTKNSTKCSGDQLFKQKSIGHIWSRKWKRKKTLLVLSIICIKQTAGVNVGRLLWKRKVKKLKTTYNFFFIPLHRTLNHYGNIIVVILIFCPFYCHPWLNCAHNTWFEVIKIAWLHPSTTNATN